MLIDSNLVKAVMEDINETKTILEKSISLEEIKEVKTDERTVTACISYKKADRDGDVVLGLDWNSYLKNPIVVWNHQIDDLPIAKCIEIWEDERGYYAKLYFPNKPELFEGEWLSDKYYEMFKTGLLNSFSISFTCDKVRSPDRREMEMYKSENSVERILAGCDLIEISAVSIPANSNANVIEVKSFVNSSDEKAISSGTNSSGGSTVPIEQKDCSNKETTEQPAEQPAEQKIRVKRVLWTKIK